MASSGIEPATFRLAAQCLNATACRQGKLYTFIYAHRPLLPANEANTVGVQL
jgi:hypothetical protein